MKREIFKKGLALLLALAMCLCICACQSTEGTSQTDAETAAAGSEDSSADSSEVVSSKDKLVVSIPVDPVNLNWNDSGSTSTQYIVTMVLEALVTTDLTDGYTQLPCLAESWEFDDDLMGITFYIRDDVYFHNGEKMTVDDVVYSLSVLAAAGARSSTFDYIDYENVTAIDETSVYVPLKEYNVNALTAIGYAKIFCKSYMEANADDVSVYTDNVIGTGPYKMVEWISGDSVTVERFDDYWGTTAKIETIVYRIMSEMTVSVMEAETGGVDIIFEASYSDASPYMDTDGDLKVLTSPGIHINYLGFNLADETMNNLALRQAIAYAIDRDAITIGAFDNSGYTAMSIFPETEDGVVAVEDFEITYDLEKAKELMVEAGYPDGLTLTIVMDTDSSRRLMAEQLNSMLSEIGITLDIQTMETAAFSEMTQNTMQGYQLYLDRMGGSGPMIQQTVTYTINKSTHMDYFPVDGYSDLLSLVSAYAGESDSDVRAQLVAEMTDRFADEWMYWVPVNHREDYTIINSSLQGLEKISGFTNLNECWFE